MRQTSRGGGGRIFQAAVSEVAMSAEGARDLQLCARAHEKMRQIATARGLETGTWSSSKGPYAKGVGGLVRMLREMLRDLGNGGRRQLSPGQLRVVLKVLGLEEAPPIRDGAAHPVDVMAAARPLRPPGR